jgi:error-prone DNA polymerase
LFKICSGVKPLRGICPLLEYVQFFIFQLESFTGVRSIALPLETGWDQMMGEYGPMGMHPQGHIMARLRPTLPASVARSDEISRYEEGGKVTVAGFVIRRQRPSGKATFITLEDEFGHSPLVIWPDVYKRVRLSTVAQLLIATGTVSRREGTLNIVVEDIIPIKSETPVLQTKDWG